MNQASETYLVAQYTRPYKAVLLGGDNIELTADHLELRRPWCGSSFSLGQTCAASLTLQAAVEEMPFAKGDRVELEARLQLQDDTYEAMPLGVFTLTKLTRETDSNRWTLTGADAIETGLAEPLVDLEDRDGWTAAALLSAIALQSGLTVVGTDLVPDVAMVVEKDASGATKQTLRELLGRVALVSGANAVVDRYGRLTLCRFGDTASIGPDLYYQSGLSVEDPFTFGALSVTKTDGTVYSDQLSGETQGLAFTCDDFNQGAFDTVWSAWQGAAFRPGSVRCLGDLRLDPGDLIRVETASGETYTLAAMELAHQFDGGFTTTVTSYAPPGLEQGAPQSVSQVIAGVKTDLARFGRVYADELIAVNAAITHLTADDIEGANGTINLAEGTFNYGDVLVWDGSELKIVGNLTATSGSVGGWTIGERDLSAASGSARMYLIPIRDDEDGRIGWDCGESTANLTATRYETGTGLMRLRLELDDTRLDLTPSGVFANDLNLTGAATAGGAIRSAHSAVTIHDSHEARYGLVYSCYVRFDLSAAVSADTALFDLGCAPAAVYACAPYIAGPPLGSLSEVDGVLWTRWNSTEVYCPQSLAAGSYYANFTFVAAE